jgi:hypothetical protein
MAVEVCNIGFREARKRRFMGVASLVAGVGLAFVFVAFDAPRLSRLVVFVPMWIAGLGLFQAQARVCVALAGKSLQNMDAREEKIADAATDEQLRAKAKAINRKAVLTATVVAAIVVAFPV